MNNSVYWVARGLLWLLAWLWFRWRIEGKERLPRTGPVIIFSNHASWWDIPLLGCAVPRRVRFMAKAELFRNPILGGLLRAVGAFPVHRHSADRHAIRQALAVLAAGEAMIIFPEGTRSRTGQLLKPEPGTTYLAHKSGAPLMPVGISSPYRLRGPATVRVGNLIPIRTVLGDRPDSEQLAAASQRLMDQVAALLVPELLRTRAAR